jgi:hypothetical protein
VATALGQQGAGVCFFGGLQLEGRKSAKHVMVLMAKLGYAI